VGTDEQTVVISRRFPPHRLGMLFKEVEELEDVEGVAK
jgi:hypothetical protein